MTFSFLGTITAQTALIKDPDGYCNIRESASSKSKVIDTIHNERLVYVFSDAAEGEWFPIDYHKTNLNSSDYTVSGYIHKSRITFISNFTKFNKVELNDSILKLRLDSFNLTLTKRSFNKKGRQLKYDKSQGEQIFVKSIDKKFPLGTDGNIPKKEYKAILLKIGKISWSFPSDTFKDLFEPNFEMTMAYYNDTNSKIYIEATNSDGAGGYLVIWTIKEKQIIRRETFIPL
jgi:hypothetical protein